MKRYLVITVAILTVLSIIGLTLSCSSGTPTTGGTASPAGQKAVVLRLATLWPVGDPVTNNIQEFVDKFNAQAKGRYTIELHPGGSLLALGDSFNALKDGAVEMAGWPVGVFGSIDPLFSMAELPFAVNSVEADAAFTVEMQPLYDKVMTAKYNMKPVFVFTCLGLDIISVKPVRTLEDWKGLLCQTISPQTAKVVELLGGAGVAMDFSEGYQAIQKKVIEASLQSASMMIMFKMNEVAKYVTSAYLTPASIGIFINLDTYKKMPADIQKLIVDLGKEAQTSTNNNFIKVYNENYKTMAGLGMTVYRLPKTERERWAALLKPYAEELLAKMDKDTADNIRKITQELDSKYPYTE
jgi:TRAP-type C4-dicarboxylate transport system substrate-binding protein